METGPAREGSFPGGASGSWRGGEWGRPAPVTTTYPLPRVCLPLRREKPCDIAGTQLKKVFNQRMSCGLGFHTGLGVQCPAQSPSPATSPPRARTQHGETRDLPPLPWALARRGQGTGRAHIWLNPRLCSLGPKPQHVSLVRAPLLGFSTCWAPRTFAESSRSRGHGQDARTAACTPGSRALQGSPMQTRGPGGDGDLGLSAPGARRAP